MLFNRFNQIAPGTEVETATFQATSQKHANKITSLDAVAGLVVTLPTATGSGDVYRFLIKSTITSNTTTIKVPDAATTMTGEAISLQDAADTVVAFETAADSDTMTLNGSTTGGLKGQLITITDAATDLFLVESKGAATGTEATPFSATVS